MKVLLNEREQKRLLEEVQRLRAKRRARPESVAGVSSYRTEREPLERAFDTAWRREQARAGNPLLAVLLADQRAFDRPGGLASLWCPQPSERDYEVAATVVQWLGTQVGRAFIEEVLRTPEGEAFRRSLAR